MNAIMTIIYNAIGKTLENIDSDVIKMCLYLAQSKNKYHNDTKNIHLKFREINNCMHLDK